jgi:hypothetical protein
MAGARSGADFIPFSNDLSSEESDDSVTFFLVIKMAKCHFSKNFGVKYIEI